MSVLQDLVLIVELSGIELDQIISQLEHPSKSVVMVSSQFRMKFGVPYRVTGLKRCQLRLVVPRSMVRTVLENAHAGMTGGHLGIRKTLTRLRNQFLFRRMKHVINQLIQAFGHSQRFKSDPSWPSWCYGQICRLVFGGPDFTSWYASLINNGSRFGLLF